MKKFETIAVHGGSHLAESHQAITSPIFQTSTFEMQQDLAYQEIRYSRMNNTPNHLALHEKLALLEEGEDCLTFGSGMAAISSVLMSTLSPGDHVLVQDCIYGGTFGLLKEEMNQFGFKHSFINASDPDSWKTQLRPETKAIYVESMTNPLLGIAPMEEVVSFAKEHGLISIIDNTFASPYNFQPLKWGFDLSVHSATKYLNGHADVIAGCVIGRKSLVQKTKSFLVHLGASLDPFACFLLDRGLKTLALRMERHNFNGQKVAEFLSEHERVKTVHYPGLTDHPSHEVSKKWFRGFAGVLSFEVEGGLPEAEAFLGKLSQIRQAPSLGGVESLAVLPAKSSHAGQGESELKALGFGPQLIRLAIGVENVEDLIDELSRAL